MTALEELMDAATPTPEDTEGETETLLVLHDPAEAAAVSSGLDRYFREEPARKAVRLVVEGRVVGYLNRAEFRGEDPDNPEEVRKADTVFRSGLGSAEQMRLPGNPLYQLYRLRCPVPDCQTEVLVVHFKARQPELCPVHPTQALRPVP